MNKTALQISIVAVLIFSIPSIASADRNRAVLDNAVKPARSIGRSNLAKILDASKVSIGPVKLGMKIGQVKRLLGKPNRQVSQPSKNIDSGCRRDRDVETLEYNRLKLIMSGNGKSNESVRSVITSNPAYLTSEGIRVGDSIDKVQKTYAKYRGLQIEDRLIYGSVKGLETQNGQRDSRTRMLSFKIDRNKVIEMQLDRDNCL